MEKRQYLFENELVIIEIPTLQVQEELANRIREIKANGEDGVAATFVALKKLCKAKHKDYDFNQYSEVQFRKMVEEVHLYRGLEEIINEAAIVVNEIIALELQRTMLALKESKVKLLVELIHEESAGLKKISNEIYQSQKEKEKLDRLAEEHKKKRKAETKLALSQNKKQEMSGNE